MYERNYSNTKEWIHTFLRTVLYCCGVATIEDGEALPKVILAEKSLLANNFQQGLKTIERVTNGANYDPVIQKLCGCALPVLFRAPQFAKTTALKAALSVVGNTDIKHGTQ